MTKKEAIEFSMKMARKSKTKMLFSYIIAGLAIGDVYRHAYNAGAKDIKDFIDEDVNIALSINGKEV